MKFLYEIDKYYFGLLERKYPIISSRVCVDEVG